MKKLWAGILVAGALGLLSPCAAWARPRHNGDLERQLDGWFSGIGEEMNRAGDGFARAFLYRSDHDD